MLSSPVYTSNVVASKTILDHDYQPRDDQQEDSQKLDHNEEPRQSRTSLRADRVQRRDNRQHQHRQQLMRDRRRRVINAQAGIHALNKHNTQNGKRRRHSGYNPAPSCHVPPELAEDVSQVGLDAAFARNGGAQLGHGERACPGEDAAEEPDEQSCAGRGHVGVYGAWGGEDARADYDADKKREAIDCAEVAGECAAGLCSLGVILTCSVDRHIIFLMEQRGCFR